MTRLITLALLILLDPPILPSELVGKTFRLYEPADHVPRPFPGEEVRLRFSADSMTLIQKLSDTTYVSSYPYRLHNDSLYYNHERAASGFLERVPTGFWLREYHYKLWGILYLVEEKPKTAKVGY